MPGASFEIPLSPQPQRFRVQLVGITYNFVLRFANALYPCWFLDILDANSNPLAQGLPLLPGVDILHQHRYLGIQGYLWVSTDGDQTAVPTFDNLGIQSHLYFAPFS